MPAGLTLTLDEAMLDALAQKVAAILESRALGVATAELPRYLTVNEAADYLRCSRQRVYDLCSQRSLRRLKDGSRVLLDRAEIDAYLAREALALTPR
ncbi:MAG TPA: helix-turn-helix domain-containing protein [Microbacteriaceae bacterium]|jgi:excisionase family DNA binding protein|nr:helix-turn-helix domain-containing protein [Microbacteriaceae bacterium]